MGGLECKTRSLNLKVGPNALFRDAFVAKSKAIHGHRCYQLNAADRKLRFRPSPMGT
jgi:hypothetical protein